MAIGDHVVTRVPEPEFLLPSSEPLEPADLKLSDLQLQSQTTRVPFSLSFNTLLDFMTLYAQIRSYPVPLKMTSSLFSPQILVLQKQLVQTHQLLARHRPFRLELGCL